MTITKRKIKYFLKYGANKKLINYVKVNISRKLKLENPIGYPYTVMIEPTNLCNLKCPLCPTGVHELDRTNGLMDLENFKKFIDEVQDHVLHLRMWNWGEPFLNKNIGAMISYAKKNGMFVNLSTNGTLITEDLAKQVIYADVDEIIVSIDGATQETYEKYRIGGDLEKVKQGVNYLINERKKQNKDNPKIIFQFIAMKQNEHERDLAEDLAKELQVDYFAIKTVGEMDVFLEADVKDYLPHNKDLARYIVKKNDLDRKLKSRNMCDTMYEETTIMWNGDVVPCCNDPRGKYKFGNAFESSFKQIWKNSKYTNFRKAILENKEAIPMCKDCPGNTKDAPVLYQEM